MHQRSAVFFLVTMFASSIIPGANAQAAGRMFAGAADVEIHKLHQGVWMHTSYYSYPNGTRFPSNGLIIREGDSLLLVDTAWGELLTLALLAKIEAKIGLPVRRAVVTHAHGDRLAGVDVLEAHGVAVYALALTQKRAIGEGMPVPDHRLAGLDKPGTSILFGSVELYYPGPGHAPDNLMVWVPTAHVLFGGCAVRSAAATRLGGVADANMTAWSKALHRAQTHYRQAEVVVPGHGASGGLDLLDHTLALLDKHADDR